MTAHDFAARELVPGEHSSTCRDVYCGCCVDAYECAICGHDHDDLTIQNLKDFFLSLIEERNARLTASKTIKAETYNYYSDWFDLCIEMDKNNETEDSTL